jgi:hypothetical protein
LAAFALVCAALTGVSWRPPRELQEKVRSDVELVYLDVSVLDRDRHPIPGLTKLGSVYSFVDVPDSSREPLTLSGPFLTTDDSTAVSEDIAGSIPLMPLVHRSFSADDRIKIWLRIHQGAQTARLPVRVSAVTVSRVGLRIPVDRRSVDANAFDHSGSFATFAGSPWRVSLPASTFSS